jgi:ubiquinol-cytochrome c reductase cytochrome c1 subunit
MKKLIVAFLLAAAPMLGLASTGGVHLDAADIDLSDQASLQRGAKYFVNYTVFPDVGMPHVLWELQGTQKAVYKTVKDASGHDVEEFDRFEPVTPGLLSAEEYDQVARDLTAFLSYVGEPIQMERKRLGIWVLLFIAVFFVLAYLLKKEYWKDIH